MRRFLPFVTDHYYHIFNRSVNKQPIFLQRPNYQRFIDIIRFYKVAKPPCRFSRFLDLPQRDQIAVIEALALAKPSVSVLTYCIMPNHFHLLVRQEQDRGISNMVSVIQNSYAKYFNIKYGRVGAFWQGPFKAVLVEDDEQLLHVSRYIHLNPYTSDIIQRKEEIFTYPWSSIGEYVGTKEGEFCRKEEIVSHYRSPEEYAEFIRDRADYQKRLKEIEYLFLE
ncbi:MAG: transposase [bacterium]|nr:transposase [bacterium]